jgi:DNA-binding NtrC family response regulator
MIKKTILLIEDDAKTEHEIKSALGDYAIETVKSAEAAAAGLPKTKPALIIIDYDLKKTDGLQVFRELHPLAPHIKFIMLSSSNDIPLAVTATKLGVSDFLKKPAPPRELIAAVERNIVPAPETSILYGQKNLILLAERGVDKKSAVEHIHLHSLKKRRKLRVIDAAAFRRENLEASFWATVQEAIGLAPALGEEERCGTLYLDNIDGLEESFRSSIFEFFKEKKEKIDKEALVVLGLFNRESLRAAPAKHFVLVEVPPLRERKDDLPQLIAQTISLLAARHNKKVRGLSGEMLSLLGLYDWPGNYAELECLLEAAVLAATAEILDLKDLPLDARAMIGIAINKSGRGDEQSLVEARRKFEKIVYKTLQAKTGGDTAAAARFLDMPKTMLAERAAELGNDLIN